MKDLSSIYRQTPVMYSIFSSTYILACRCNNCNEWFVLKGEVEKIVPPRFCEKCYEKKWIDIILDRV